jgi:hypothetical protein
MRVEDSAILIVLPMDLKEVCAEILNGRLIIIWTITERSNADTPISYGYSWGW